MASVPESRRVPLPHSRAPQLASTQALFLSVCLHPIQISLFYLLGLQGFLLICCCCLAELCLTPWTAARQAPLSSTISRSLLQFMSIESMMSSNHLITRRPPPLFLSIFLRIRVFSESALPIRWPKCWRFIISPSNEYSGLISFRIDWFDLLAVQGTLKSLLQHHSSNASILYAQPSL